MVPAFSARWNSSLMLWVIRFIWSVTHIKSRLAPLVMWIDDRIEVCMLETSQELVRNTREEGLDSSPSGGRAACLA